MPEEQLIIDIQPPVSVYATYRRLSYLPWYAIAEFVDNSTQNYYDHKHELKETYGKEETNCLRINIDYDTYENILRISDNANGMDFSELSRAVKLNVPPPNPTGRCEYGMGLKTAACWFGRKWSIETTRLRAQEKFTVTVDVDEVSQQSSEKLLVDVEKNDPSKHFTIITIQDLYKPIHGRTAQRIKEQLSSMYREDLRNGEIEIYWNDTGLLFQEPPILEEVLPDKRKVAWKKEVVFEVPWEDQRKTLPVKGWIGIRIPGSQRDAGFVLLRRGRVIVGGPERGYKPEEIFGQGNTFRSQRLIGEFHLDEWAVTQAKDAFDWSGGLEDKFIELLKDKCKDYMEKAEGHRVDRRPPTPEEMEQAAEESRKLFESKTFSDSIKAELVMPTPLPSPSQSSEDINKLKAVSDGPLTFTLKMPREEWIFIIYWQDQISDAHWMSVEYPSDTEILIYLNSNHPFFEPYMENLKILELLQKFVLALALAEKLARQSSHNNLIHAADFRNYMNRVLRYASQIREDQDDNNRA